MIRDPWLPGPGIPKWWFWLSDTYPHVRRRDAPDLSRAHNAMRQRCLDPNHKQYKDYGGRGIKICRRWSLFSVFCYDMGPKPSPKHSIDRINNDGHYTPGNCRWATPKQQANNKRKPQRRKAK